jgi:predicted Zn-dependent protease
LNRLAESEVAIAEVVRYRVAQRLVMHEVGHALGLGHPNADNPFGAQTNFDTDGDLTAEARRAHSP